MNRADLTATTSEGPPRRIHFDLPSPEKEEAKNLP